jgi:glutathione S-transferase
MTIMITAFAASPDEGHGHGRDMRVRWALEEAGVPYEVRLAPMAELKEPAHRARHPFGKIPTFEEGDLTLFESGAIVFHIAERHPGLLPEDANARARAIAWMFAALTTIEPPVVEREAAMILEKKESWYRERQRMLEDRVRERLGELSSYLGNREWLDGEFSAGDLLMVTVLRRLEWSNVPEGPQLLREYPSIEAYVVRGENRPAYKRAFEAQRSDFLATKAPEPVSS